MLLHNRMTNVNARQNDGATALTLATRLAIEGVMQELITADADVNATDGYGRSNVDVSISIIKYDTLLSFWSLIRLFFLQNFSHLYAVFALGHKKTGSWDPIGLKTRGPQNKNWVPT